MNIILEFIRRLFFWPPDYPQTIQIGITNVCNFDCKICQRFDLQVAIKHMDFDLFTQLIDKIDAKKAPNLILTGWGEPLCNPRFLDMVKVASDKGFKIRFTSNASLLSDDYIKKLLEYNLTAVTFSIDELSSDDNSLGHKITSQLDNIKNFIKIKKELKKNTKVYFQTTYPKNGESGILKIIDYASQIGVDRVKISRLDVRYHDFARPNQKEEKEFVKKIEKYIKDKKIEVDFLPYLAFGGLARKIYKRIYSLLHQRGKYCLRIFSDLYINVNGFASPCCAMPNYEVGNVLEKGIVGVWNSLAMKSFRKEQKLICGACDVLEINYKG